MDELGTTRRERVDFVGDLGGLIAPLAEHLAEQVLDLPHGLRPDPAVQTDLDAGVVQCLCDSGLGPTFPAWPRLGVALDGYLFLSRGFAVQ